MNYLRIYTKFLIRFDTYQWWVIFTEGVLIFEVHATINLKVIWVVIFAAHFISESD